ncbi:Putative periplasmic protein-TrxB [hydrothermal vent metagenome]|uniref:Putative periplasmic protein-TrxB n=1 Tax=hydrothermal vent metagenome TaxID=652676 RepID=A0A1W1EIL1_9ZZZZ
MLDVIIIGGGASGFGCALTLASVEDKFTWAKDKKYMIIDDNNSDIEKARFYNLTGVDFGISGSDLLNNMKTQLANYKSVEFNRAKAVKIVDIDGGFEVITTNGDYRAKIVVIATGMHSFDIECDGVELLEHKDVLKPNKIFLKNDNLKIRDNLFVVGLASGAKTMFAIANGEGARVACDIFKIWTGKPMVAHDSIKN